MNDIKTKLLWKEAATIMLLSLPLAGLIMFFHITYDKPLGNVWFNQDVIFISAAVGVLILVYGKKYMDNKLSMLLAAVALSPAIAILGTFVFLALALAPLMLGTI